MLVAGHERVHLGAPVRNGLRLVSPSPERLLAPVRGARRPQSLVTGEYRSSRRLVPSVPKSIFATAFGPAPSTTTTVPIP